MIKILVKHWNKSDFSIHCKLAILWDYLSNIWQWTIVHQTHGYIIDLIFFNRGLLTVANSSFKTKRFQHCPKVRPTSLIAPVFKQRDASISAVTVLRCFANNVVTVKASAATTDHAVLLLHTTISHRCIYNPLYCGVNCFCNGHTKPLC